MSEINYELVYKMRQAQDNVRFSEQNLENAKDVLADSIHSYRKLLSELISVDILDIDFLDSYACLADGIRGHAIVKRHCVFCGCFDPREDIL